LTLLDGFQIAAGTVIVAATLYDFFESQVLPRPAVGRLRPGLGAIHGMWRAWLRLGGRFRRVQTREAFLATFGPASVLILLALRGAMLIFGYGLILHGLRDQLHPPSADLGTALYFSGESLLTLGFGDFLATGPIARLLVLLEAATGLGLFAVAISLLFSLFSSFQRRETAVISLDALAGAPPSGVQLLEASAGDGMTRQLEKVFDEWRVWTADVLESHLAYPVLTYFRSSHDNEAWLNSFGAVMDAAVLVLTAIEGGPAAPAKLMVKVGGHFVADLGYHLRYLRDVNPWLERHEFDEACDRLRAAGYRVRDDTETWEKFARHRGEYASLLNNLARDLALVPAPWIGDRSYLPHAVDGR
jgi:hypothetical protein